MARFLRLPFLQHWPTATSQRRYVNGLILIGLAGAGKSAFLARQVEQLLQQSDTEAGRENPNLVLFLRGNGIALRPEGMSRRAINTCLAASPVRRGSICRRA